MEGENNFETQSGGTLMRRITNVLPLLLGVAIVSTVFVPAAEADVTATVVTKSGQRHTGNNLAYRIDNRQVVLRTSQAEEPRIPVDQVAYVDFGGTPEPRNLNLSGSQEAVVLRDGTVLRGQVVELGHTNKGDLNSPFLVIVKTENGQERRLNANEVARVYFSGGSQTAEAPSGSSGSSATVPNARRITVSAQQQWTSTGITVQRGQTINLKADGEIKFGPGSAPPSGSGETHPQNPLPGVPTGALIGRIGNSAPFLLGNQTQIVAPASGQLFLGVNDSYVQDNQGAFEVDIQVGNNRVRR
jgi:hypothetical protein